VVSLRNPRYSLHKEVSADDDDAKKRVDTLLETFTYSVIDLGDLRDGGLLQQAGGPLAGQHLLEEGQRHK
jgi:predicted dinucleotide-binding enzyme